MSIKYKKIDSINGIILVRDFVNVVGFEEIIESWEYLIKNNMLKDNVMGVINDLRDCELNMDMKKFETLITYMQTQNHLKGMKLAVVCDLPGKLVFPMLAESRNNDLKIKGFSTISAAEVWINY